MRTWYCPGEHTVTEDYEVADSQVPVQFSQHRLYGVHVGILLITFVLSLWGSRSERSVSRMRLIGRVSPCRQPRRRGKTCKPAWAAPPHMKSSGDCRVHHSPSFSSTENHKFCNRGTLDDFYKMCFPQCSHKRRGTQFRNGTITSTFNYCPKKRKMFADELFL